jgi:hypothetical protein
MVCGTTQGAGEGWGGVWGEVCALDMLGPFLFYLSTESPPATT